jgi:receptor protein-tyrosine kinase
MQNLAGGPIDRDNLNTALTVFCGLSARDTAEIGRVQKATGLEFSEAAMRVKPLRREDLEHAYAFARTLQQRALEREHGLPPTMPVRSKQDEMLLTLRSELLMRRDTAPGRANVIAIVSPCPGEGRSWLAASLARSFAQLNQPTLLVDSDLRRPIQHLLFGVKNLSGLAEAIAGTESPRLLPVEVQPGLQLLTAGGPVDQAVELLTSPTFGSLLNDWSRRFEHIIFDTPPVVRYPDAIALAPVAGRVLAVSRANHTPIKATREMLRRLDSPRVQVLGAVVGHF